MQKNRNLLTIAHVVAAKELNSKNKYQKSNISKASQKIEANKQSKSKIGIARNEKRKKIREINN